MKRLLGIGFAFFFAVLCMTGRTYGWQSVGQSALNVNQGDPELIQQGDLIIEKQVENADGGELTEEQLAQEFAFTVTFSDGGTYVYQIDGGEEQSLASGGTLLLKHGQKAVFKDLPEGVYYEVRETAVDGYWVKGSGHQGNITPEGAKAVFRNIYSTEPLEEDGILKVTKVLAGEQADPEKEFTFTVTIDGEEFTFTLKGGESKEFQFPAGTHYQVEEKSYYEDGYLTVIEKGNGILVSGQTTEVLVTNTYVGAQTPEIVPVEVALPKVEKKLEGENIPEKEFTFILTALGDAPMPEGTVGRTLLVNITGKGTEALGSIKFDHVGTYYYKLEEMQWQWENWTMDPSVYTLIYQVTEKDGVLLVHRTIKKDGQMVEDIQTAQKLKKLAFVNSYEDPEAQKKDEVVIISGEKKWSHRDNPVGNWPTSVTIYIFGDGELVKELVVTEDTDWIYVQEFPKYAEDGHEIVYTLEERPVPGYDTQIQGYNIVNIYHSTEETENPENDHNGGGSGATDTSDHNHAERYLLTMVMSLSGLILTIRMQIEERKYRRRRKRARR